MPSLSSDRLYGVGAAVAVKAPVLAATQVDEPLSGLAAIDGVTVSAGDRILVKSQSDASENGVYVAETGAWSRAPDFNGPRDVVSGTRAFVVNGATHGGVEFVLSTADPIVIGATALSFQAIAAATSVENAITATRAVATAGQTVFALDYSVGAVMATVNGAVVDEADFTALDGVTITFAGGLNAGDAVVAYSLNGAVNAPTTAFSAKRSATVANVTGAGADYQVLFDAVAFDAGGDYAAGAGEFTAPKSATYQLQAGVTFDGVSAAADEIALKLVTTTGTHVAHADRTNGLPDRTTISVAALVEMTAGDTAHVTATVTGEAANSVDILGGADASTHFSGFLLR